MYRFECLICEHTDLIEIINLGSHAFADTFISQSDLSNPDLIYSLICDLCQYCGHIQTRCITDPSDRYIGKNYSYTSANSEFSRNHWDEFANAVLKSSALPKNAFVVEIGSNDGYLLEQFARAGCRVIGVDPSHYMSNLAEERGVETITDFWVPIVSEDVVNEHGKADFIIANNVFNHANNPTEFVSAVSSSLSRNGKFMFEVPYLCDEITNGRFDQIYHEHVSYFTVRSIRELLHRVNMRIHSIEHVNYHGGSLRVVAQNNSDLKVEFQTKEMVENERSMKTFDQQTYVEFMKNILSRRSKLLQQIYQIKNKGNHIVAVGAAAKGNTFLSFCNLDHHLVDWVTDSSKHKQGKFTPKTRIPIVDDNIFEKYGKVYALILSWNISNMLKKNLYKINPNIKYLDF